MDLDIDFTKIKNKTIEVKNEAIEKTLNKNFYLFLLFFIMLTILLITFKFKLN